MNIDDVLKDPIAYYQHRYVNHPCYVRLTYYNNFDNLPTSNGGSCLLLERIPFDKYILVLCSPLRNHLQCIYAGQQSRSYLRLWNTSLWQVTIGRDLEFYFSKNSSILVFLKNKGISVQQKTNWLPFYQGVKDGTTTTTLSRGTTEPENWGVTAATKQREWLSSSPKSAGLTTLKQPQTKW